MTDVVQQALPQTKRPKVAQYKPFQRMDYNPEKNYRVDERGFELCSGAGSGKNGGEPCPMHAANYSGKCLHHGGMSPSGMSRWDALQMGFVGVEDLDDEELVRGCARNAKGEIPAGNRMPKKIPVDIYHKMINELYKRHDERLRSMLDDAISTVYGVMVSPDSNAGDKLKAADWIFERVRGKPQERVAVEIQQKPWQEVLNVSGVARVSQDESREARGLEPLEAEIVPLPGDDTGQVPDYVQRGTQDDERPLVQGPAGEHLAQMPGTAEYDARQRRIAERKARLVGDND